jgi:hypothetical protein
MSGGAQPGYGFGMLQSDLSSSLPAEPGKGAIRGKIVVPSNKQILRESTLQIEGAYKSPLRLHPQLSRAA